MRNLILELKDKFKEVKALNAEIQKHPSKYIGLVAQYIVHTGVHIERGIGEVINISDKSVRFRHYGWEYDGSLEVPLELFIEENFIKNIIDDYNRKMEKEKAEYLSLKAKFEKEGL